LSLAGENGNIYFFLVALLGAFVTSIYTFRMVYLTFFGVEKTHVHHVPGNGMNIPLIILALLSTFAGFIQLPHTFGHLTLFSDFLSPVLPAVSIQEDMESLEWLIQLIAAGAALSGVYVAYLFYIKHPELSDELKTSASDLHQFWFSGWGFDSLYNFFFVRPFVFLSNVNKNDIVDKLYSGLVLIAEFFHRIFSFTQSGILRWYIMGIVVGGILLLTLGLIS